MKVCKCVCTRAWRGGRPWRDGSTGATGTASSSAPITVRWTCHSERALQTLSSPMYDTQNREDPRISLPDPAGRPSTTVWGSQTSGNRELSLQWAPTWLAFCLRAPQKCCFFWGLHVCPSPLLPTSEHTSLAPFSLQKPPLSPTADNVLPLPDPRCEVSVAWLPARVSELGLCLATQDQLWRHWLGQTQDDDG